MLTEYTFIITGKLPGLNEYIKAERTSAVISAKSNKKVFIGNSLKAKTQKHIITDLNDSVLNPNPPQPVKTPADVIITWYFPNKKLDIDNATFGVKFIFDAMVKAGIVPDDSPKYIRSLTHVIRYDAEEPHIVVKIQSCDTGGGIDIGSQL